MYPLVYETSKWIGLGDKRFIYSHALNRKLSAEEHSHEFFEVVFLFSGTASHRVNKRVQSIAPGYVAFLRPGDTHVFVGQSDDIELYSISVVGEEFLPFLTAYHLHDDLANADDAVTFQLTASQLHAALAQFRQLDLAANNPERDCQIRIILGSTLHCFMTHRLQLQQDWLHNVMKQMNTPENMAEGVPAMMRLVNLSHAQLCRITKKERAQTPQSCIRELRLSSAYELIQSTDLKFEDIAQRVGYSSFSHFSAAFKRRFGVTPSFLRKSSSIYFL